MERVLQFHRHYNVESNCNVLDLYLPILLWKMQQKIIIIKLQLQKKNIELKFVGLNLAFRWKLWGGDELNLRLFCKSSIHACFMHVGFMKEADRPATVLVLLVKNDKRVMNMIMVRGNILCKFAIWENQLEFNTNIFLV